MKRLIPQLYVKKRLSCSTGVFLFALLIPFLCPGQNADLEELAFDVYKIYPPLSIEKEKLNSAHKISDLNKHYKPSWVREYIATEILTTVNGRDRNALGKDEILTLEQKELIHSADPDSDIAVKIKYIPENTLKNNLPKMIDFTFSIEPETEASFPAGQQALIEYLKIHAIDRIPEGAFQNLDLAAVKFTVGEGGDIEKVHLFESSKDEKIDELLLESIRNMPSWLPAQYSSGLNVPQELVLTVGNMKNCMVNLLNINMEQ